MDTFPEIRFDGQLRPSQKEVVDIAREKLKAGKKRLHIVAPPGSGKTVLGLFLWAECICRPAVVLSPNSAIQAQWAARTDLFIFDPSHPLDPQFQKWVSTAPESPSSLTSLTYQSVTLPKRASEKLDDQAEQLWQQKLIDDQQAENGMEAENWIADLKEKNNDYYERRLASYRKKIRDEITTYGNSLDVLHRSSQETLDRLKALNVGLIILDECHHLMGHWGRVLADAREHLGDPHVIGLTATPPDRTGISTEDVSRYDEFFGEIDYEVPVPAVVKDGFLAPYQDLAFFVRPTAEELEFVATTDQLLDELIQELCQPRSGEQPLEIVPLDEQSAKRISIDSDTVDQAYNPSLIPGEPIVDSLKSNLESGTASNQRPLKSNDSEEEEEEESLEENEAPSLPNWLFQSLEQKQIATRKFKDWYSFERRDTVFANSARSFLQRRRCRLPEDVPSLDAERIQNQPTMDDLLPIIDRYVRHALRRSSCSRDHQLAIDVTRRLRLIGAQITETGVQACASPVGRVLAYSRNKALAVPEILRHEIADLQESIRAVIVTDFEKSSATLAEVGEILDEESGGAVAVFRAVVNDPSSDTLDPVLITGSSVLVDDDAIDRFMQETKTWLQKHQYNVELTDQPQDGFHVIIGSGKDWCPRVYVEMITELFQRGITKCLVGTRGLLGEGWDASKINVLIDLTSVTTSMTVNQLRGRSIRIDKDSPNKLANNWDVICIAPEFTKGLDDYKRFERKHQTLYGVTDDGAIEKGVGHVHAAFTEIKPEGIEGSTRVINADMLERAKRRAHVRELWKIGQPYQNRPIKTLESRLATPDSVDFPPFRGAKDPWNSQSLTTAIGNAILFALSETGLIEGHRNMQFSERQGGFVRLFLQDASDADNQLFVDSLYEALGPLESPRYIIPRHVTRKVDTWLSKILPTVVGRFFQKEEQVRTMFHAVPTALSRNKTLVDVFERGWNAYVSPGEAVYTLRGQGEETLAKAKNRVHVKRGELHNKEIFL